MPGYDSLGGLDMHAAFQKGMSSFAVWKEAVPQSPEISSSFLFSSMAVFAFGQMLSLDLRAKEPSTV